MHELAVRVTAWVFSITRKIVSSDKFGSHEGLLLVS